MWIRRLKKFADFLRTLQFSRKWYNNNIVKTGAKSQLKGLHGLSRENREKMIKSIIKLDKREVPFNDDKITQAIVKAFIASGSSKREETAAMLTKEVVEELEKAENPTPGVEDIQDVVEDVLMTNGFVQTAKAYILYRAERNRKREMDTNLMRIYQDITFK